VKTGEISLLFDYHYWALNHLLAHLNQLTTEQLATPSPHLYHKSAFQTVLHLLDVDWSRIQICMGLPGPDDFWEAEDLPDLEAVKVFIRREESRVKTYVRDLNENELAKKIGFGKPEQYLKQKHILLHIINHGTEHRTELGHFLTENRNSPGELGFVYYLTRVRKA
jgi:uncharacterized damage-inducible protein DinB